MSPAGQVGDPISALIGAKRSEHTRRAYAADLADFFRGAPTPAVVLAFLQQPTPVIAGELHRWKAQLLERGLSEATVNRRLSSMRALLKVAHRL